LVRFESGNSHPLPSSAVGEGVVFDLALRCVEVDRGKEVRYPNNRGEGNTPAAYYLNGNNPSESWRITFECNLQIIDLKTLLPERQIIVLIILTV